MKNSHPLVVSNIKQETVDSVVVSFKIDKESGTMQFGKGKGKLTVPAEKSTENRINKPEQFKAYKQAF